MKFRDITLLLIVGAMIGALAVIWWQAIKEEAEKRQNEEITSVVWRQDHFKLSEENLYNELVAQEVLFPEIVQAQAILETGHFKSNACLQKNNLFGLRKKDGTYMSFAHWTDAVAAYKEYIQRWKVPPNDYYQYLDNLGYAEDAAYVKKVKEIVNQKKK